jgi:hypothetical protein
VVDQALNASPVVGIITLKRFTASREIGVADDSDAMIKGIAQLGIHVVKLGTNVLPLMAESVAKHRHRGA